MKILAFGEILWDVFLTPDGTIMDKKIGGAPFNFAAHCAKLGAESYIISAVGNDANGRDALEEAQALGINTDYVAFLPKYPTGACAVTLENGLPNYNLISNVAYDHIPNRKSLIDFDALYMGTLAMRKDDSKTTFRHIINSISPKEVLFDVNFRKDFYNREIVEELLSYTTVLKISDEEIGFFGNNDTETICLELAKEYPKLKYICLTLGKEGAIALDCKRNLFYKSKKPQSKPLSTVGAGDSFAAAFFVNLLNGEDMEICMDRAVRLSDFVVTQMGAVPDYDADLLLGK